MPHETVSAGLLATFHVRGGVYAFDAAAVREVVRLGTLTAVPHARAEVLGVINLRGRIVTILDVGLKLGFKRIEPGAESRVFIVDNRNEHLGLVVDRVGEVVEVQNSEMEPNPSNVPASQAKFFAGVYRMGTDVVTVIDLDCLFSEAQQ